MLHFTRRSIWFPLALVLWNRLIIQKVAAIQPLEFQADLSDLLRLVKQSNCLKTLVSLNSVYGDEELSKISNIVDTLYSSVESSNQSSTGESAEAKLFYQKRNLAAVSLMFHQVCDDVIDVDQIQEILDLQFTSTSQSVDDNFPAHQSAMEFFKSDLKPQNMKGFVSLDCDRNLIFNTRLIFDVEGYDAEKIQILSKLLTYTIKMGDISDEEDSDDDNDNGKKATVKILIIVTSIIFTLIICSAMIAYCVKIRKDKYNDIKL